MTRERAVNILNDFIEDCPNEDWEQALQIAKNSCEKLGKIEQIIKDYDTNCGLEEYMYLEQIKEVLEQE